MKHLPLLAATLCVQAALGQSLQFTSGVVSNYSAVNLSLSGPSNLVVQVERLNPTNNVWEAQGTLSLTNGFGSFSSSLVLDVYGFFRAKSTNNAYYSTNAFGAVVGEVGPGKAIIGNLFNSASVTNLLPDPAPGMQVLKFNNASNNFTIITFDEFDLEWYPGTLNVDLAESVVVDVPGTNSVKYLVSGLFDTNAISKSLPAGLSLLVSPLYSIQSGTFWNVDQLNTNQLGGLSALPVQTAGYNPQATLYQPLDSSLNYSTNTLSSTNQWQRNGTNVVINLEITEGFWLHKPTNAVWTIQRSIW